MSALDDIRQAIADALASVTDLEAYAYVAPQVNPPAAVVAPDNITYDADFDGGATYQLPVQFLVSLGDWQSAQAVLDPLIAHDGDAVAAINNSTDIEARVVSMAQYGLTTYADKTYLGAVITVEVLT